MEAGVRDAGELLRPIVKPDTLAGKPMGVPWGVPRMDFPAAAAAAASTR